MKNKKIKFAQSRLRRNILSLSAFLLLAAVVWLDRTFHPQLKTYLQHPKTHQTDDWNKYNEKTFTVVKVVDGDTIDINIPDANYATTRIRLLGVDSPETKSPHTEVMYFGPEAYKFTSDMVLGKNVFVIMDANSKPRDKYHRLLCYIRLAPLETGRFHRPSGISDALPLTGRADGRILNEELISQGFGYADTRFPHSFYKEYIQLEKTAENQKKGLWEKVTTDQMPQWRKTENHE